MRVYDPWMAEPYDVLFSMPWAGPLIAGSGAAGGAETQIMMLARGLASRGLKVAIAVIGERRLLPREIDGVRVIAQPRPPRLRGLAGLVHDTATFLSLLRTRSRVIVVRNASRGLAVAAFAARLKRAGIVYSSANVVDFDIERLDYGYNAWLFRRAFRAVDEVVVQTEEQAALSRERFGRDPMVIRSIAEPAEPRATTPDAFLWIGRLVPYKRLDVYLDLAADVPEARFRLIAVPGLDRQPELAARLETARAELPNVEVLEPRPRSELAPLVERAVAIVGTGAYEGMPNVFLEAWSRGVPALAFQHDPDGVIERHGLGGFAAESRERLAELARGYWASRSDQGDVASRCVAYVRREHDVAAVAGAWRRVIDAAARA
jgi:glycosyltransferase involved in cell wall biosynthesis